MLGNMLAPTDSEAELHFYAAPGRLTDLAGEADLGELPHDIAGLARLVQGLVLHDGWAPRYGVTVSAEGKQGLQVRTAASMLRRIRELDGRPLSDARPPERRFVGICRHISVLTTALLRHVGVPARARCGFGTYFEGGGRFIDHWIVEHWDARSRRWVRSDAQLDALQCETLCLDFDPLDLPAGRFLAGGEAWQECRAQRADPGKFGIYEYWGGWFIRNNVVRDLAALNKVELLPWDAWGLMDRQSAIGDGPSDALVDQVAAVANAGEWSAVRSLYQEDARLRAPDSFD